MSTETWKLETDLCRCCHSEGLFKNLAESCVNLGQEEIYSDMLRDCFDIDLSPVPGMLCLVTYMICDNCILRLRDAFNFKKQVLACERRFRDMYNRNILVVGDNNMKLKVKLEEPDSFQDDYKEDLSGTDNDVSDVSFRMKYDNSVDSEDAQETVKKKQKKDKTVKKKSTRKSSKKEKIKDEKSEIEEEPVKKKGESKEADAYYNLKDGDDGTTVYACSACDRTYRTLASVVQHYRHVHLHLRPKLRSCYYCEMKVASHARAFHLEKEHGIPAPSCGACGKKFAYPFQVLRHQKHDHMGEKKFRCDVCDMMFTSHANLAQHIIKHSSARVHKCQYCEKSFKWKKNLITHIMMHQNDRRHVCRVCNEAFVQQTSLKYHITKRHPEMV